MTALNTTDYLDRVESMWAESIRRASLVAEVIAAPEFEPAHVATTLTALGRIARKYSSPAELAEWPSCVLVSMTYRALEDYQQGAFWDTFSSWFVERRESWTSYDNTLWGEAYLRSLRTLRLPTFETTRRYVGNIVLHAGVPSYCFPDLLRVLAKSVRAVGPDGPAAVSWLRARSTTSTFSNIDTPVRDFIVNGDVFAADFVARTVELLDRLQNGEETAGVGLAVRYVEAAHDFVGSLSAPLTSGRGAASRSRPTLKLDTASDRLLLDLPAVPSAQGMRWQISADGEHFDVRPPTAWATDHGAAATTWDVPRPAQQLVVRSSIDADASFALELISERMPYLLFSEDGTQILPDAPLANAPTWVLRLDDGSIVETDGSATVIARGVPPLGWSDWALELVDLQDASFFTVGAAPRRRVTTRTRARFLLGEPRAGLAANGTPVFAAGPRVDLPPDVPEVAWTVSVKDLQTGAFLASPTNPRRPLDHLEAPLVGTFEIAVRGPLARGARTRLSVVEGLDMSTSPAFRSFSERGLEPSEVAFSAAEGVALSERSVVLGQGDPSANIVVSTATARLDLVCTPPGMAVSLEGVGHHTTWQHRPLSLPSDAFSSSRILLRLPPNAKGLVPLRVQSSAGVHQHLDSIRQGDSSTAIHSLDKAADTVSSLGAGRLVVSIPSGDVLVASFRPAALAESATTQGSRVHLDGLVSSDVEATCWALYAPWLGARTCPVVDSRFVIPDDLAGRGPLVLNLRIADPWTSEEPPTSPVGRDLFLVDAPIDAAADRLTRYLGGADTRGGADFDATKVMAQLSFSSPFAAAHHCRLQRWQLEELTKASQPDERLAALVSLDITRPRRPHLVVLSGTATERFSPDRRLPEPRLREALTFNPLEFSLRNLQLLADAEAPDRFPELWRQAEQTLGASILDILSGLDDPHRSAPTFDPNSAALHALPPASRELLIASAKFLPSSVADPDARAVAALQLLTSIGDRRLREVTVEVLSIISEADRLLRRSGFEREADAVRSREDPAASARWMALPAASLAIALCARLGARGHGALRALALAHQDHWASLSAVARKLTEIDLVLAEAYAASASRTTHPAPNSRPFLRDETGTA